MKKQYIGGRLISRERALEELGDPLLWPADASAIQAEFQAKRGVDSTGMARIYDSTRDDSTHAHSLKGPTGQA